MVQFIVVEVAIARDLRQADGERWHIKDSSDSQIRDSQRQRILQTGRQLKQGDQRW
jgi:hypothetical protein